MNAVSTHPAGSSSAAVSATVLAPATLGCMMLPTTNRKMLCMAGVGATILEQFIPTFGAKLASWPAAAFLTANIARTAFAARLPEGKLDLKFYRKNVA